MKKLSSPTHEIQKENLQPSSLSQKANSLLSREKVIEAFSNFENNRNSQPPINYYSNNSNNEKSTCRKSEIGVLGT